MKTRKLIKLTLATGIVVANLSMVHADFNIYADPSVVAQRINNTDNHSFKQIGESWEKATVVESGYGPLGIATEHLIPDGWELKMDADVDLTKEIVKWKGGVAWPYALESISANHNMDVVVNWERRYVSIGSKFMENQIQSKKLETFKTENSVAAKMSTEKVDTKEQLDLLTVSMKDTETPSSNEKVSMNQDDLLLNNNDLIKISDEQPKLNALDLLTVTPKSEDGSVDNSVEQMVAELSPKEKFELEKAYNNSYVLPIDSSFEGFVQAKELKKHEYMQLTYVLKSGMTVQENIREWASAMPNDWTVEWDAEKDFLIHKDIQLESTFIDVFPKVEVFYSESSYPIKIDMYLKNNIIHVYNKEFKINHSGAGVK